MSEAKCQYTGNICGTDTWATEQGCRCAVCQWWYRTAQFITIETKEISGGEPSVDDAIRMLRKLTECKGDSAQLILLKQFFHIPAIIPSPSGRSNPAPSVAVPEGEATNVKGERIDLWTNEYLVQRMLENYAQTLATGSESQHNEAFRCRAEVIRRMATPPTNPVSTTGVTVEQFWSEYWSNKRIIYRSQTIQKNAQQFAEAWAAHVLAEKGKR